MEGAFVKLSSYLRSTLKGLTVEFVNAALSLITKFSARMGFSVNTFPHGILDIAKKSYPKLADNIDTRVESTYLELGAKFFKKLSITKD